MLWTITKKQVLINLLSYRFVVGFILCQVLFVLATVILVKDYEDRVKAYGEAVSREEERIGQAKVYSDLVRPPLTVYKPPARLSPICTGFEKTLASQASLTYYRVPELEVGRQEKNGLLAVLGSLDLVTVIQLVLGLLVLLFAHDSVSGERERGTLALSLSGPLPRHVFLLGHYLGGMVTIVAVFLVGALLALFLMERSPAVDLGLDDWVRLGLIVLVSLVYLSALYLLGITASVLSKRSATALVVLLFFWIVFIVIFPNLTSALAARLKPVPARGVVTQQASALRREFWTRIYSNAQTTLPMPARRWDYAKDRYVYSGSLPYPIRIYHAPREMIEWELEGLMRYLPLEIEYADKVHSVFVDYERQLQDQARLARTFARFSPAGSYYNTASSLAGTDAETQVAFLSRARRYRNQIMDYVSSKNGFMSYRFFTRREPKTFRTYSELDLLKTQADRLDLEIGPGWDSVPPLDLRDLPAFNQTTLRVRDSLMNALPDLLLLIFLNLAFFLIAHVCFLKTDVRVGG
jgi:ABC-type transport system involved in multi-copper enzyme maturation permease subunit